MRKYREGEIDFFAVYYPPTGCIYAVPFGVIGTEGRLRLAPVLNGQQKFIRWAADFTWEKHVEWLRQDATVYR